MDYSNLLQAWQNATSSLTPDQSVVSALNGYPQFIFCHVARGSRPGDAEIAEWTAAFQLPLSEVINGLNALATRYPLLTPSGCFSAPNTSPFHFTSTFVTPQQVQNTVLYMAAESIAQMGASQMPHAQMAFAPMGPPPPGPSTTGPAPMAFTQMAFAPMGPTQMGPAPTGPAPIPPAPVVPTVALTASQPPSAASFSRSGPVASASVQTPASLPAGKFNTFGESSSTLTRRLAHLDIRSALVPPRAVAPRSSLATDTHPSSENTLTPSSSRKRKTAPTVPPPPKKRVHLLNEKTAHSGTPLSPSTLSKRPKKASLARDVAQVDRRSYAHSPSPGKPHPLPRTSQPGPSHARSRRRQPLSPATVERRSRAPSPSLGDLPITHNTAPPSQSHAFSGQKSSAQRESAMPSDAVSSALSRRQLTKASTTITHNPQKAPSHKAPVHGPQPPPGADEATLGVGPSRSRSVSYATPPPLHHESASSRVTQAAPPLPSHSRSPVQENLLLNQRPSRDTEDISSALNVALYAVGAQSQSVRQTNVGSSILPAHPVVRTSPQHLSGSSSLTSLVTSRASSVSVDAAL